VPLRLRFKNLKDKNPATGLILAEMIVKANVALNLRPITN
jgi:hypothetical protein